LLLSIFKNLLQLKRLGLTARDKHKAPLVLLNDVSPLTWASDNLARLGVEAVKRGLLAYLNHPESRAEAFVALGNIEMLDKMYASAIEKYKKALEVDESLYLAWANLANAYRLSKEFVFSRRSATRAVSLQPELAEGYIELFATLLELKDKAAIERYLPQVLKKQFRNLRLTKILAAYWSEHGNLASSIEYVDRHLEQSGLPEGDLTELLFLKVILYAEHNNNELAELACKDLIQRVPAFGEGYMKYGVLLRNQAKYPEAMQAFEQALEYVPEPDVTRWHMALCRFLKGEYNGFWNDYEFRRLCADYDNKELAIPEWDGAAAVGSLLICTEQGVGDEIMFAGFVSRVVPKVGSVTLECSEKLVSIYRSSFPSINVIPPISDKSVQTLPYDSYVPIGSLPKVLGVKSQDEFCNAPYLKVRESLVEHYRAILDGCPGKLKVGVSWRGGVPHTRMRARSIALGEFSKLLGVEDICFFCLQYNLQESEKLELASRYPGLVILEEALRDYEQTAALVTALDLVVSVQTAVVHLAGAIGTPVEVLLSHGPEWRYGGAEKMLWYENVVLNRQTENLQWSGPINEVLGKITDLAI